MSVEYEAELRRRIKMLKLQMEQGKLHFAQDVFESAKDSILKICYGPDGEIDLSTVDGSVRAMAMAVAFINDREDSKKNISLSDLQKSYFEKIDINFGYYYRIMKKRKLTPHDVAHSISRDEESVRRVASAIPEFIGSIEETWRGLGDVASIHVEDTSSLKAVFGGDLFPANNRNIASICGVYIDTVVLPDPFIRTKFFLSGKDKSKAVYFLMKHALNLLKYKDLAIAEIDPPIVVVVPDRSVMDENDGDFLSEISEKDVIAHLGKIFERNFLSLEDAMDFVKPLSSIDNLFNAIKDRSRLLFDIDFKNPLDLQLKDYMENYLSQANIKHAGHAGEAVVFNSAGRMRQANDVLLRSRQLGGVPLIDAPTSWKYFQWKLEYDVQRFNKDEMINLHLSKALQTAANGEMMWLGNVPPAALIEMRRVGAIDELRKVLSVGITDLVETNPSNFYRTGDQVIFNIQRAFDAHRKELGALKRKKWRFAGIDIGTCITRGAVEIASACGVPAVSLIKTILEEVTDAPKFREIPEKYRKIKEEDENLRKSSVGILFRCQS